MDFDPTKEYGNFVEIVPTGKKAIHSGAFVTITGLPWDEDVVEFAEKVCQSDFYSHIPNEYHDQIITITKKPEDNPDPFLQTGTVGWKYKPLQKGE